MKMDHPEWILMRTLLLSLLLTTPVIAVIGGEISSLAGTGTAYSSDISAVSRNPANSSFLSKRQAVNTIISGTYLAPAKNRNLRDEPFVNGTAGIFLPDIFDNFGICFVQSVDLLNHGVIPHFSSDEITGTLIYEGDIETRQVVYASNLSCNWRDFIAVGVSVNPTAMYSDDSLANIKTSFGIGVRGQYPLLLNNGHFITPGIGSRYFYEDENIASLSLGYSLEYGKKQFIYGAFMHDIEFYDLKDFFEGSVHNNFGLQLNVTPFVRFNQGVHHNRVGGIFYSYGFSLGFNRLHTALFLESINKKHRENIRRNIDIYYSFSRKRTREAGDFFDKDFSHELSLGLSFGKL